MIRAIVLDVDGVIIGEQPGVNSPHPHPDVTKRLSALTTSGVPVILCTGKSAFAIKYEIEYANLNNPHITDGGAVILGSNGTIAKQHTLDRTFAVEIVSDFLNRGIYTEVYTADDYYTQEDQICDITDKRKFVMQKPTKTVPSLARFCKENDIIKILQYMTVGEMEKNVNEVLVPLRSRVSAVVLNASTFTEYAVGLITKTNCSKEQGLRDVSEILGIPTENMLGVGDSTSDWSFMEQCGYVGAMGNSNKQLKDLVAARGDNKGIVGTHVNENGLLYIFDSFCKSGLLKDSAQVDSVCSGAC